jgi:hypothetical protein
MRKRTTLSLAFFSGALLLPVTLILIGGESPVIILVPAMFAPVTIILIATTTLTANCVQTRILRNVFQSASLALSGMLITSASILLSLAMVR